MAEISTATYTFIQALITAINSYATTMNTFTGAAATTAMNNLATATANATAAYLASVKLEGE